MAPVEWPQNPSIAPPLPLFVYSSLRADAAPRYFCIGKTGDKLSTVHFFPAKFFLTT
jgi:hypothetical protein